MLINLVRFKFSLKQIVKYNKNTFCNKILSFKKRKWDEYKFNYKNFIILSRYKRYKILDHLKILLYFFGNKSNSYIYKYKNFFDFYRKLKHLYAVKKFTKLIYKQSFIVKFFETNVDFVILKSKFCFSIKLARQYIKSNKILINSKRFVKKQWFLKPGDILKFLCEPNVYKNLLLLSQKWPVSKYVLNYSTKELVFLNNLSLSNFGGFFPLHFKNLDYDCGFTKIKV